MGGNRRHDRRRKEKETSGNTTDSTKEKNRGIIVHLESNTTDNRNIEIEAPPVWSDEFVENIEKKSLDGIPSVGDIGLQMVRGTLERISSKSRKKAKKHNKNMPSVKPTPIQLVMWPALLKSFDFETNDSTKSVVGIAPTGTGKTMSYVVPIISHCIRTLLCQTHSPQSKHATKVHGLVLVPTRELAIQVSKEFKVAAKVANKYLSKGDASSSMEVESMAVYGGVDIESQRCSLLGKGESSSSHKSLVVAATAGRLLDILKQFDSDEESVASPFENLQAVVFDEADRIAVNVDMAGQVDEILSILKSARVNKTGSNQDDAADIVSCLVSATLPEKAKEMCEKWVPRTRVVIKVDSVKVGEKVIKVDSVKVGEKQSTDNELNATKAGKDNDCEDTGESAKETTTELSGDEQGKKQNAALHGLDLSSIPSNIVQTLHVCSNHKKPKKLILTLQRIYMSKNAQSGRFSANNRLTIVFFGQIKTLKNMSKLLVKEGLRCVELYGSLPQEAREKRLLEFKCGKRPILLATDVAARGLHVPNVHFVVNYDFPSSLDQYVHRCGRAGRKQALSGVETSEYPPTVYSFYPRGYVAMVDSVIELLKACNAWVDPNLLALTKSGKSASKSGRKRKRKNNSTDAEDKTGEDEGDESDKDDQFAFLGRSVLKRASNVSDAEDSDESS